jgi:WD40 repeat protein
MCPVDTAISCHTMCCCQQPETASVAVCCSGPSWHLCDFRAGKVSTQVSGAHDLLILSVDMSPSKPYLLATAGKDCSIKVWDIRWVYVAVT